MRWMTGITAAGLTILLSLPLQAEIREIEPGIFADDFEDGQIGQFTIDKTGKNRDPKTLNIVKDGGHQALFLNGDFHSRVFFSTNRYRNCVVETRIKKGKGSYAGVVVRDNWFVYFQMRGALCLNAEHGKLLFQSDQGFQGYHDLKVVCVGPVLRAYVDGEQIFTQQIADEEGRVGFYAHHADVHYDSFRISPHVDPLLGLRIEPRAPDDSLVVAPGETAKLAVTVFNYSNAEQPVTVTAAVKTWDDAVISKETRREVKVGGDKSGGADFDLGRMPAGFYKVELGAQVAGKEIDKYDDLPLAVQERGAGKTKLPVIPIAPYSKYGGKRTPIYQNTYAHAVARSLKDHHFNAIVADPSFNDKIIEIFQGYGIAVITRGASSIQHSNVIGALMSDEPKMEEMEKLKQEYAELSKTTAKPLATCMVGEGLGLDETVEKWRILESKVRAFRWYGVKKSFYGIQHRLFYKGVLSLADVLNVAENCASTPYWVILPSFGITEHEGYFHNPSPAEMRGLMHLALAYGADGLLFYTLETEKKWAAFVDRKTLQPCDGKYEAAAKVAALIGKYAELFAALRPGAFEVRNSNPARVEAVPRRTEAGRAYIYIVNKNADAAAGARLAFKGGERASVTDLFSGREFKVSPAADGFRALELTLDPCDAALLEVDAVVSARRTVTAPAGPAGLSADLTARAQALVEKNGIAILGVDLSKTPCIPGDAIGFFRADDPRAVWKETRANPRCFSWSGLLDGRSADGFLPLDSALRVVATADAETPYWTVYPALGQTKPTPAQLRAMVHLALAFGSKAVLISDADGPELAAVIKAAAQLAVDHGKLIAELKHGGMDVRCPSPVVDAIPLNDGKGSNCVYAINKDTENPVTTRLLLWDDLWTMTSVKDVFGGKDLAVTPRDQEGFLSVSLTLAPGEGKLLVTDAKTKSKK